MHAVRLDLDAGRLPDNLRPVRDAIEARVPVGFTRHTELKGSRRRRAGALEKRIDRVLERAPEVAKRGKKLYEAWRLGMGTLGGGNHFIELCLDEADRVWLMLHSGSRRLGAAIGEHFIQSAREEATRLDRRLPDRDLGWLEEGTELFERYWEALTVAQDYAQENRRAMTEACLEALAETLPPVRRNQRSYRVSPQLHKPGEARRRRRLRHPQGRDQRTRGRTRHRARVDGCPLLHRAGAGKRRELPLLRARGRTPD